MLPRLADLVHNGVTCALTLRLLPGATPPREACAACAFNLLFVSMCGNSPVGWLTAALFLSAVSVCLVRTACVGAAAVSGCSYVAPPQ